MSQKDQLKKVSLRMSIKKISQLLCFIIISISEWERERVVKQNHIRAQSICLLITGLISILSSLLTMSVYYVQQTRGTKRNEIELILISDYFKSPSPPSSRNFALFSILISVSSSSLFIVFIYRSVYKTILPLLERAQKITKLNSNNIIWKCWFSKHRLSRTKCGGRRGIDTENDLAIKLTGIKKIKWV